MLCWWSVVCVHHFFKTMIHHGTDAFHRPVCHGRYAGNFFFLEWTQNIRRKIRSIRRKINPASQSGDVLRAGMREDGSKSVVPAVASAPTKPQMSERELDLVIHDQEFGWFNVQLLTQERKNLTATVHVRPRFTQIDMPIMINGKSAMMVHMKRRLANMQNIRESIQYEKSDIVSGVRVAWSRVAEPDHTEPPRADFFPLSGCCDVGRQDVQASSSSLPLAITSGSASCAIPSSSTLSSTSSARA